MQKVLLWISVALLKVVAEEPLAVTSVQSWQQLCDALPSLDCDGPRTIPREICELKQLKILRIDDLNVVGTIPEEIGCLSNLVGLSLEGNKLTGALPRSLGELTRLYTLSLARNKLTSIPEGLDWKNLAELGFIGLEGNIFQCSRGKLQGANTIPWEKVDHSAAIVCDASNEFDGVSVARLRFLENEPLTSPAVFIENRTDTDVLARIAYSANDLGVKSPCTFPRDDMRMLSDQTVPSYQEICEEVCKNSLGALGLLAPVLNESFPCELLQQMKFLSPNFCEPNSFSVFEVEWRDNSESQKWKSICTVHDELHLTKLKPFSSLQVRARAVNLIWAPGNLNLGPGQIGIGEPEMTVFQIPGPRAPWKDFRTRATSPDGPPVSVQVVTNLTTESSVGFSWEPPTQLNGLLTGYRVQVFVNGQSEPESVMVDIAFYVRTTGLAPGGNCTLQVAAVVVDEDGTQFESQFSDPVTGSTSDLCPEGTERQDVPYVCVPCPKGTFRSLGDREKCQECPGNLPRTLSEGSTSSRDCVAAEGSIEIGDGNKERTVRLCTDPELIGKVDCSSTGTTVENLGLRPGYWRASNRTLRIAACPISEFCRPSTASSTSSSPSNRRITTEASGKQDSSIALKDKVTSFSDGYCSENHTGIFCEECVPGFGMGSDGCVPCQGPDDLASVHRLRFGLWALLYVLLVCMPSAWLVFRGCCATQDKQEDKPAEENEKEKEAEAPGENSGCWKATVSGKFLSYRRTNSIKLVARNMISFYQVFFPFVATTSMMGSSHNIFVELVFGNINFSALLRSFRVDCSYQTDFYDYLLAYTLFPMMVIVLLIISLVSLTRCCVSQSTPRLCGLTYWLILVVLFLVYPGVSSAILRVFLYDDLVLDDNEEGHVLSLLRSDYSKEYGSAESEWWRVYASVMIAIFTFGVIVFFALCAHYYVVQRKKDEATLSKTQSSLMHSFAFLSESYRFPYFESVELLRKLLLTSGFLLVYQANEVAGVVYFTLLNGLNMLALSLARPFVDLHCDLNLAVSITSSLLLFAVGALAMLQIPSVLDRSSSSIFTKSDVDKIVNKYPGLQAVSIVLAVVEGLLGFGAMLYMARNRRATSDVEEDDNGQSKSEQSESYQVSRV